MAYTFDLASKKGTISILCNQNYVATYGSAYKWVWLTDNGQAYIDDPIFSNSKIVLSMYDDTPAAFPEDFKDKILIPGVTEKDVEILTEPSGINLAKLAATYSDGIIYGSADIPEEIKSYCKDAGLPALEYRQESFEDGSYIEDYNSFYDQL